MQETMNETNIYLKSIFEERQSAPKRPRVCSEAAGSVESANDDQPAPKRAKSGTNLPTNLTAITVLVTSKVLMTFRFM